MKLNVTFSENDLSFSPAYDKTVVMDTAAAKLNAMQEGSLAGVYEDSDLIRLRMGAFAQCKSLTRVSLPGCEVMNGYRAFYECENVHTLHLPKLTTIEEGNYTFYGMANLEQISLPNLTSIQSNFAGTFWNCVKIKQIYLPKLTGTTISNYAFHYCYCLEALVLGGDSLNPLANTNAFNGTGLKAARPFEIYVPDGLVETYKTAQNWSSYAHRIKPISQWEGLR